MKPIESARVGQDLDHPAAPEREAAAESGAVGAPASGEAREPRPGPGRKAVGLVSGGLDSTLAAEMVARQGVDVTGLYFSTGFCKTDHRRAVRRAKDQDPARLRNEAIRAGADGGFPVEVVDVSKEYLEEVVLHPKHGYGAHINPCIDCRIFMLRKAKEYADGIGAETVFTGEVIGQRPFSQYRSALRLIEEQSGLTGRLLRPLSAHHLEPTRAEQEGRLDRESFGRLGGRSRRGQEELARTYGIEDYPQPSGGCCFLADETYARRFKELVSAVGSGAIDREQVLLLKVGRQFRLSPRAKLHVGREEAENRFLHRFAPGRWVVEAVGLEGPTGILNGSPDDSDLQTACAIVARYADRNDAIEVDVALSRYESGHFFAMPEDLDDDRDASRANTGEPILGERRVLRTPPAVPERLESMRL